MKIKKKIDYNFAPIPHNVLKALCKIRISGVPRQLLDTIMLKTYGFHKEEDWISLTQFMGFTNLQKPIVCRGIKYLLEINIIKINNIDNKKYKINEEIDTWLYLDKKNTAKKHINNNDNKINNIDNVESLSIKKIGVDNNDNVQYTKKIIEQCSILSTTIDSSTKNSLQKKVVQKKELSFKIENIKKEFNEFIKTNNSFIIEQAEIVFAKPFETGIGFDPFIDYWIRKEVGKMRDWIDEKTDKSQNLKNYDSFIAEWFKREKPYPAYLSVADENLYYSMKGSSNVG